MNIFCLIYLLLFGSKEISRSEKLHNKARLTCTLYSNNSGRLLDSSLLQRSWIKQARSSEIPAYFCNYYISRLLAVIRNGLTQWVLGLLPWSSPRGCPESALAYIRNTVLPFNLVARKRFSLPCHNSTVWRVSQHVIISFLMQVVQLNKRKWLVCGTFVPPPGEQGHCLPIILAGYDWKRRRLSLGKQGKLFSLINAGDV